MDGRAEKTMLGIDEGVGVRGDERWALESHQVVDQADIHSFLQ